MKRTAGRKKVACHAYNGIGLQRRSRRRLRFIEHGLEITDAQIAANDKARNLVLPDDYSVLR